MLNNLKKTLKSNEDILLYIVLFILVLAIKLDLWFIDVLISGIFLVLCIYLNSEKLLQVYIYMYFFENVSNISFVNGTLMRILLAVAMFKLILEILKKKPKINKTNIVIFLFMIFFYVTSIVRYNSILDTTAVFFKIMLILLFKIVLGEYSEERKDEFVRKILDTIIMGVLMSVVYGFITNNYYNEERNEFITRRFNGTKDPNFLAFYINLAMAVLLVKPKEELISKKNIIIMSVLIIALALTKSVTGIIINIISIIFIILIKNKEKIRCYIKKNKLKTIFSITILICIIGVILYGIIAKNSSKTHINENGTEIGDNRVAEIIIALKNKDIDRATSRKTLMWKIYVTDFIENTNIYEKLFGRGINIVTLYNDYFSQETSAHCTYIDIINSYGIVGGMIIYAYIFIKTKNNIILERKSKVKEIKMLRILMLIYAVELSIYTHKLFLIVFLL